jgi:hypothetical protein
MMIAAKYREANMELLRAERKNERLFLGIGAFVVLVMGLSIPFLVFMAFLIEFWE